MFMQVEVAIVGGTNILNTKVLEEAEELEVKTPFGKAEIDVGVINGLKIALIRRHGRKNNIPPHKINHAANFWALKELGVKKVLGMGSVGCLKKDVSLPAIAIPHDYIDFFSGATVVKSELLHITPGFDEELRKCLINEAREVCSKRGYTLLERAIYFQSRGPRLETKAEVRIISQWADCVGMTAGSEATVCKELGIRYAALCTVDNYANGISDEEIDYKEIVRRAKNSANIAIEILLRVLNKI